MTGSSVLPDPEQPHEGIPNPKEISVHPQAGELRTDPRDPVAEAEDGPVRHSTGKTTGQHANPHREPRSAANNSVTVTEKGNNIWLLVKSKDIS